MDDELARAAQESSSPTDLLERLLTLEANALIQRRIERRIKESKLPDRKLLSDFDFTFQKGVNKTQIMELAKPDFVDRKQGVIIAGNSGTGPRRPQSSAKPSPMKMSDWERELFPIRHNRFGLIFQDSTGHQGPGP